MKGTTMHSSFKWRALCVAAIILCAASHARAMTEEELEALYLDVVEEAVTTFEPIWKDDAERVPDAGYFDFSQYGNWRDDGYAGCITVPGNGMIVFCYAVLLTQTDKEFFAENQVPRSVLLDHATKALRWLALTNIHSDTPYPYAPYASGAYAKDGKWTRPKAFRADMQGWLTVGTALLWDRLDPALQASLETALVGESLVEYVPFTWREREGGLHDCVKHYLSSITAAAFLFPKREEGVRAMELVRQSGIDIVATWHDRANATPVDGKPVRDWVKTWNLYQEYASDHHAHAQIWYGCDLIFEGRTYLELLSHITGLPVPETFTYDGNGFDGVLAWAKRISSPECEPIPVQGTEYDSYYGAGLLAFCYGAVLKKDPVAAALEEQAAQLLERQSRAVRQYDYHRNSWAKAAAAYLMHTYCGPRAEPVPIEQAKKSIEGVYHHPSQLNIVHRAPDKWVSWSWGILPGRHVDGHCGLVIPGKMGTVPSERVRVLRTRCERDGTVPILPLIYAHANTLVGRITGDWLKAPNERWPAPAYTHVMKDNGFDTAGVREAPGLDQYRAFFSFSGGPCVLFTRFVARKDGPLTWSGVPVYFYVRDGVTQARTLYHAQGACPLEQPGEYPSSWWCVDDRLGLVASGGAARLKVERVPGLNWARIPEYRDQCDVVSVAPVEERETKAGDTPVEVVVAVYADTPHERVAAAAEEVQGDSLALPDGWQGLVAPDAVCPGKRYLTVANLDGARTETKLDLTFPEGAPMLDRDTCLSGASARVPLDLAPRESYADVFDLYAAVLNGNKAIARRLMPGLFRVAPVDQPVEVRFTFAGPGAPRILIRAAEGAGLDEPNDATLDADRRFVLTIDQPTLIEIVAAEYEDAIAPAVEIADVDILPDGRTKVTVTAGDQSGMDNVELHLDGKPFAVKTQPPYTWTLWPGAGFHTFAATATDASPKRNKRTSFRRTIEVAVDQPVP